MEFYYYKDGGIFCMSPVPYGVIETVVHIHLVWALDGVPLPTTLVDLCFSPFEHLSTLAIPSSSKMVQGTRRLYFFKIEM